MANVNDRKLQNFIGGQFVDPAEGQTEPVLNPATGETIAEAPVSSAEDVDRAVKAARKAFPEWSTTTPGERALALLKLAETIEGARATSSPSSRPTTRASRSRRSARTRSRSWSTT